MSTATVEAQELREKVIPAQQAPKVRVLMLARALLGWMNDDLAKRALTGARADLQLTADQTEAIRLARVAVAARPDGIDQAGVVAALPDSLAEHAAKLRSSPSSAGMFSDGWDLGFVDLSRVCAFQQTVFTESARGRVGAVTRENMTGIAEITLPTAFTNEVEAQFNPTQRAWMLMSANPNLKIVGQVGGPLQTPAGEFPGFGFLVTLMPSFLQVARFQGRYFLRDGYHRAYGLLVAGITHAPAFVRDFDAIEDLAPAGMLQQAAYLGSRPPMLPDFLDDAVSIDVRLPAVQKMIVVQALELTPLN